MAKKGRHRKKPEPTQEEQVAEFRGRCRGPAWWSKYSREKLAELREGGRRLREEGYGSYEEFSAWLVEL